MASHSLDLPLPFVEPSDATEADAHLRVPIQPQQAGGNGAVAAAPTAGVRRFDLVTTNSGRHHDGSSYVSTL
jgi:hypothetical protein